MPRETATYFSDSACCIQDDLLISNFSKVFILITPPERITSRNGLGPFSVGQPKCIYNHGLTNYLIETHKNYLLVFPGYEGFEAKSVVDAFVGHNSDITCALSCFHNSYSKSLNSLIGNQALISDSLTQGNVELVFYFSRFDILRISLEFMNRALNFFDEYPEKDHALIIAPFGPKSAIFTSSVIRKIYTQKTSSKKLNSQVITDVITIPSSQYVSLYSRGYSTPCIFEILYSKK